MSNNSSISEKYALNVNDLKYYHIFGIFCTLIGIILIVPKISTYYKEKKKIKESSKDNKTRMENIFTMLGCLFLIYGLKEIFFRQPTDTEIVFNKLLLYLRETNQLSIDVYNTFKSYTNHSVLDYIK